MANASRGRVSRDPPLAPTPETARKLRSDVLRSLYTDGLITESQFSAGMEIRAISDALSCLWLRSPGYDPSTGARARPRHHLDGLPPELRRLYLQRYMPWSRAPRREVAVVIGVVVDCRQLDPNDYDDRPWWRLFLRGLDAYGAA